MRILSEAVSLRQRKTRRQRLLWTEGDTPWKPEGCRRTFEAARIELIKGKTMQATLKRTLLATGLAASMAILALTGCQSTSDRSVGRKLDDRIVNSKVKDALSHEPMYKFPEIRVMTYDGVVQLSGFVNSEEQKNKAGELAKKVEGVHDVINNISLKPTATGRDSGYQQSTGGSGGKKVEADVKTDTNTGTTSGKSDTTK
jgi:hypothetical protein